MFVAEFHVPLIGPDRIRDEFRTRGLLSELAERAIAQAMLSHASTPRLSGRSFVVEHTFPVAFEAVRFFGDYLNDPYDEVHNAGVAALLHDVPEDDPTVSMEHITERYSLPISRIVYSLTRVGDNSDIYYRKLANSSGTAKAIKFMDRCNNILSSIAEAERRPDKLRRYVDATEEHIFPLTRDLLDTSYYYRLGRIIELAREKLNSIPGTGFKDLERSII